MREIHSIPLDNPFLRSHRRLVHRLDNALFNHNGSNGPAYEPTHYLLMLPFWYGVAAAVYCIYCSLTGPRGAEYAAQQKVMLGLLWLVGANMLFMAKRIVCMPSWPKRILYPVFVAVVTALYAFAILYLSYLLAALFCIIVAFMAVFGGKGRSSSSGGSFFSGKSNDYPDEIVVNDGSFWGKSLHRENDYGLWRDRSGQRYQETCTGFEKY